MSTQFFVGADVHQRKSMLHVLDANGREFLHREVRTRDLARVLKTLPGPFAICYEASCGYGAVYDRLAGLANRVAVAHPGDLRLIFRAKRKNDGVDAEKLARLLYLDQVPEVYVPSPEVRAWRQLIEYRMRLVGSRTRVKCSLRALLRGHGIECPFRAQLWTRKGVAWLLDRKLPAMAAFQRQQQVAQLDFLDRQIRDTERYLADFARDNPAVKLLMTIPGVGIRTAEAVVAYIDKPGRFRQGPQVGAYFGLVPSQDQSGGRNHLGRITREGPGTVRRLLSEAVWVGIRHDERIRARFEQVRHDDPQRRKIAVIATARWLATVMHAMLRTGEAWRTSPAAA